MSKSDTGERPHVFVKLLSIISIDIVSVYDASKISHIDMFVDFV